jgi:uncharacterized UBP type Zn finger protein
MGTHTQDWEIDATDDQQVSFTKCLGTFFNLKRVENVNCPKCKKKTTHSSKKSLLTFPKMLVVVIDRFVKDNWIPKKKKSGVVIPNALKGDFQLDFEYFKSERDPENFD